MRELSSDFLNDFKCPDGILRPVFDRITQDCTLMLAIRDGYVNIYYRGGNILKLHEKNKGTYSTYFDNGYVQSEKPIPTLPPIISRRRDAEEWVDAFPRLKEAMDIYFSKYTKPEREFQQLIARENNFSSVSSGSEYFITDIEFADSEIGARFDMLAIRWLASHRRSIRKCRPALIELKYGDGSLAGNSGLLKHMEDIDSMIKDKKRYSNLIQAMQSQFNQLNELGLFKIRGWEGIAKIELYPDVKPEVIFILSSHNPRSTKLGTLLRNPKFDAYERSHNFDLSFFAASFAGYVLHTDCMLSLSRFREMIASAMDKI